MKKEETIAKAYLEGLSIGDVVPEPNDPPDFVLTSTIGVEVRRLNEQYFRDTEPKGLDDISIPLHRKLKEVLSSFDSRFNGETFYVGLIFRRPLGGTIAQIGKKMRKALDSFMSGSMTVPCDLKISEHVMLEVFRGTPSPNRMFRYAVSSDDDSGGIVVQLYSRNIYHCIEEKSRKIAAHRERFDEWWLVLVDTIGAWSLMPDEVEQVKNGIPNLGSFGRLIVIDCRGSNRLLELIK